MKPKAEIKVKWIDSGVNENGDEIGILLATFDNKGFKNHPNYVHLFYVITDKNGYENVYDSLNSVFKDDRFESLEPIPDIKDYIDVIKKWYKENKQSLVIYK